MGFWSGKRVVVTGGAGFLGSFVTARLGREPGVEIFVPRRETCNLLDADAVRRLMREARPHVIVHLAAVVGGIGANRRHPGRFFYENALMGIQLMEEARLAGVEKFVGVGTICAYPKLAPVPFREDQLWSGYPEETNAPYGLAKKMLLVQGQAYRQEYDFHAIHLLPVNLYGPRDNFDPETSHVIPALIRRFDEAARTNAPSVTAWGTGRPSREFLYVEDAAEGVLLAAERYDKPEPVNLGTGREISIRELSQWIAEICGFQGRIEWDESQPDGQPRRSLDTSRARREFGFVARQDFRDGLEKTVAWYRRQRGDR